MSEESVVSLPQLSALERREFGACEETIAEHETGFLEVYDCLYRILEKRFYRDAYSTFDAYLQERWPALWERASRRHLYRLLAAAEVRADIAALSDQLVTQGADALPLPASEAAARPLAALERDERGEVYAEAVVRAGGAAPTGKIVQTVIEERQWQETDRRRNGDEKGTFAADPTYKKKDKDKFFHFFDPDKTTFEVTEGRLFLTLVSPANPKTGKKKQQYRASITNKALLRIGVQIVPIEGWTEEEGLF